MSFDPYAPEPQQPSPDPLAPASSDAVRQRVQLPAIALIVIGVLNILLAVVCIGYGFVAAAVPPDQVEQAMEKSYGKQWEAAKQQGWTIDGILNIYRYGCPGLGGVEVVGSLLAIFAGARMLALKSYGLALMGAVITAVPCISPSACCGVGMGVGLWALVVLLQPDVRSAFR
jgi:hypothetical protein